MTHEREHMNVVIVGHVDHGKSTLIGRLLADTGALPEGKLEAVKANCERNAKPFEYAFLLDALKDEQSQGITIDTARSFFKSKKRDYIIIDAPGHIEFLKNMVSGAARAEAALLVIDAHEGIQENSKRHGYMLSFLGINNITVCINKMDLVQYQKAVYNRIKEEYGNFLKELNLKPSAFIPISAREGDNMVHLSKRMPWYQRETILEALDSFKMAAAKDEQPLRFPLQDIYRFTEEEDDRRIFAGRIETGRLHVGDEVIFYPSFKQSRVKSIEGFSTNPVQEMAAGQSTGVCLATQIYVKPGEIMCKKLEKAPHLSSKFKANVFWMGRQPMVKNKKYKLKIATLQIPVILHEILSVLDASELSSVKNKSTVDRHDVAECVLETMKPVGFDIVTEISETGRFVIVDQYEIVGGGIILAPVFEGQTSLQEQIQQREQNWQRSEITPDKRFLKHQHKSAFVILTGPADTDKQKIAKALEEELFKLGKFAYFLGISNQLMAAKDSSQDRTLGKLEQIQQLGEMAHMMTDAGLILLTSISNLDEFELKMMKELNQPNKTFVINVGESHLASSSVDLFIPDQNSLEKSIQEIFKILLKAIALDPEYTI